MEFFEESEQVATNPEEGVSESLEETPQDQGEDQSTEGADAEGELNLESQLDQLTVESEGPDESKVIEYLNSLGVLQNDLPVEVKDQDHLKELLSKGANYTYETQQRNNQIQEREQEIESKSQEVEAKLEEVENYKQEVEQELVSGQVFGQILQEMQYNDPETFREIQLAFQQRMSQQQFNNPQLSQFEQKINSLESKLAGYETNQVDSEKQKITKEWTDGVQGIQKEWGAKLRSLKITPNFNKVKEIYLKNQGEISPKQAFLTVHGDLISKALKSQRQSQRTINKSNAITQNASRETRSEPKESQSMMDYLQEQADKMGFTA